MSQYVTFDHFVRDLFLLRLNSEVQMSDKKFKPIPLMVHAAGALDYFKDGHGVFLKKILNNHEHRDFLSEEQFLKFAIPRCLKLIDSERYFYSVMLIASFLLELVRFLKDTRYCYRFFNTAHKCFLAVFKRALADGFEAQGGLEGLGKFSKEAFESVDSLEKFRYLPNVFNDNDPSLKEKVVQLIEKCDDVDDRNFQLNDYELSLLKDDDVDNLLKSVENDVTGEDPLDLRWPPGEEEMEKKLRDARDAFFRSSPAFYSSVAESGVIDYSVVDEMVIYTHPDLSDLFVYIFTLEREAKERLGSEVFKERLEHRKCPCCGIKCYQVSLKLYLKQLDLALVDDSDTK